MRARVRVALVVHRARASRGEAGGGLPLQNLVFMGMGEPFDNLGEVMRAIRLLTDGRAFGFAPSRVTVSTVGVAEKLAAFFGGCRAELAVSLNAPDDARRGAIMPINARMPRIATKPSGRLNTSSASTTPIRPNGITETTMASRLKLTSRIIMLVSISTIISGTTANTEACEIALSSNMPPVPMW